VTARRGAVGRIPELDWLIVAALGLCGLGLVTAVSIDGVRAGGTLHVLEVQGSKLLVGVCAFLAGALVPLQRLRPYLGRLFVAALLLVLLAALLGHGAKGASRWLRFGSFGFQPVEPARLLLVLLVAASLARAGPDGLRRFRSGFLPVMGPAALLAAALLLQPDLGNAVFALTLVGVLALVAGVPLRHFVLCGLPMIGLAFAAMAGRGYVQDRLAGFLEPRPGDQVWQSMLAISSGGISGAGIGNGWMKMGFVPEARNDFVFAILGEELGLTGLLLVLLAYLVLAWSGLRLALGMRDAYLRHIVLGFTFALMLQMWINVCVATGLAPAKGIDLPFLSSGGTSLMISLAAVGLIGNAARADRAVDDPRRRSE
jgi:cell division protein FtsW